MQTHLGNGNNGVHTTKQCISHRTLHKGAISIGIIPREENSIQTIIMGIVEVGIVAVGALGVVDTIVDLEEVGIEAGISMDNKSRGEGSTEGMVVDD